MHSRRGSAWRKLCFGLLLAGLQGPVLMAAESSELPDVTAAKCRCDSAALEAHFGQARTVFRGTIVQGHLLDDSDQVAFTVANTVPLRGEVLPQIELITPPVDECGIRVVANAPWVFVLDQGQRTVSRCHLPVEFNVFSVDALADAVRLLDGFSRSSQEVRDVLAPYLETGEPLINLERVLMFAGQLDSRRRFQLEHDRLTFENLSVHVRGGEVVTYDWR